MLSSRAPAGPEEDESPTRLTSIARLRTDRLWEKVQRD